MFHLGGLLFKATLDQNRHFFAHMYIPDIFHLFSTDKKLSSSFTPRRKYVNGNKTGLAKKQRKLQQTRFATKEISHLKGLHI